MTAFNHDLRIVRLILTFFIIALLVSGVTAFPLQWEVALLNAVVNGRSSPVPVIWPQLATWIAQVNTGIQVGTGSYHFLAYGTDWLAFAHIVIAVAFTGPLRDPVRNIWVIEWGMIACALVIPLALVCGPMRGIPFFWQLIDCSFGIFGMLPLWLCHRLTRRIEMQANGLLIAHQASGAPNEHTPLAL